MAPSLGDNSVYQGFNEKTGWMHTSSYTDVMDEFVETVTEENGQFSNMARRNAPSLRSK